MTKKFLTVSSYQAVLFRLLRADCWMRAKSLPIQNLLNLDKHWARWIYQALTSCLDTSSVKSISSVLFRPVQYRKDISLILIFLHYSAESTSCVLFLPTIQHLAAEIFYEFKFSCNITWKLSLVFKFSILPVNSTISAPSLRQVKRKLDLIVPSVVFNHSGQSCFPLLQIDYDLISLRFQLIIKRQSFIDCCLLLKLYLSIFNIRYNTNNYSLRDSIFFSKYLLRTKFLTPLLKNNESVKSQNSPEWLSSAKHVLNLVGLHGSIISDIYKFMYSCSRGNNNFFREHQILLVFICATTDFNGTTP